MLDNDEYLQETKMITDCFYDLLSKLKKRKYVNATYFLDVAFLAYNQDVDRELQHMKAYE